MTSTPEEATEPPKQTVENDVSSKKRPLPDDGDGDKLAARREANRIHALKSRQRSKALLQELQRTVTQLSGEKSELERENAVMRAQIEVLQQQNLALTQSQRMLLVRSGHMNGAPGAAAMNAFAPGLFGLSQAASNANNGTPAQGADASAPSTSGQNAAAPSAEQNGATKTGDGMDQSAMAAAAAAMIQGQAAAAAAAAGYQPQFAQQFMTGQNAAAPSMTGFPGTVQAANPTKAANQTPAANATQAVNHTAAANTAPPQESPAATAPPPQRGCVPGDEASQQAVVQGNHPLLS